MLRNSRMVSSGVVAMMSDQSAYSARSASDPAEVSAGRVDGAVVIGVLQELVLCVTWNSR
jgi:hypothetical protein